MKYVVRKSEVGKFGYEYVVIDDMGKEDIQALDRKTPDECLYLPQNPMNRKFISISKLEKSGGYLELMSKVGLEEYLDEEDRILYLSLIEKAQREKERREKELKNLSPEEKLRLDIERLTEKYNRLYK